MATAKEASIPKVKVGIIGGTGLNNPDIFLDAVEIAVETPYGQPSSNLLCGKINGIDCVLLSRHGVHHTITPHMVNYRANLFALKKIGCTHIIVSCACGSLAEEVAPGDIVILDQFIDHTYGRPNTFYDGTYEELKGICHMTMRLPFNEELREMLIAGCERLKLHHKKTGTMIVVQGPRFSTPAESRRFQKEEATVIGMTLCPEVSLAKELGIPYAAIAPVTDYDCWRGSGKDEVDAHMVVERMRVNADVVCRLIFDVLPKIAEADWTSVFARIQEEVRTSII